MDRMWNSSSTGRSSPHIAVGPNDKENLASPDVVLKLKNTSNLGGIKKKSFLKVNSKLTNKNIEMLKNQINNINSGHKEKPSITAHDLTTSGNPGDSYWEQLSESRRVALEATWKENMDLHSKVMELEYENTKLKALLAESQNAIKMLTKVDKGNGTRHQTQKELLEEDENKDDSVDDEQENEENAESSSEPDDSLVDASFTSI